MAKLDDRRGRHDHFHRRARESGFRARSVFKLDEIERDHRLFAAGDRVLDLGCAPGSWLQYARTKVGDKGVLVGVDRAPLDPPIGDARIVVGDVFEVTREALLGELPAFDVVLSDMAPDTTGIRHVDQARSEALFERAFEIARDTLAVGGRFVGKLFQGPEMKRLVDACRAAFMTVKIVKPASSRSSSIEQYVVALERSEAGVGALPASPAGREVVR
jgi:23S rRNA (uridine2552-2'-O)-methyltransferase